jgi:SAM-dependent methyltransferase
VRAELSDYYERHAKDYFEQTFEVDMSFLYNRFLVRILEGGAILDAGCGSGRDAKAFAELGYAVSAMDASPSMAALARQATGLDVRVCRFEELEWEAEFDGVWACASLVHLSPPVLRVAVSRLAAALRPGGCLYASFEYGSGVRHDAERTYVQQDETTARELVAGEPLLRLEEHWITLDRRTGRKGKRWLNILCKRPVAPPAD